MATAASDPVPCQAALSRTRAARWVVMVASSAAILGVSRPAAAVSASGFDASTVETDTDTPPPQQSRSNYACAARGEPTLIAMAPAQRDPKVVVLGGGSWGTTVASICARRGPTLQWVRSEETADDINEKHRNSKYLGNEVQLSPTLTATTDFSEAANCADVVVMGVPSHGFRGVLTELAKELRPWVPVVSLVKGLEQGTNYRMSQVVDEVLPGHPAGILAGPNIARE